MQAFDLRPQRRTRLVLGTGLLSLASVLAGCGGGSDDDGGSSFQLLNVSGLPSGAATTWEINRPIQFNFTEPVDFSTVSSSAIQIRTATGQLALGEFLWDASQPSRVVFQPRCPTEPDLSDAGLQIGQDYSILVLGGASSGGLALRSAGGDALASSQQRTFSTPNSTSPDEVFFDTEPTPPQVVTFPLPEGTPLSELDTLAKVRAAGVSHVEYGDGSVEVLQVPGGAGAVEIGGIPLNLYSGGDQRFSLVLEFDQPVNPDDSNINSDRLTLQFLDGAVWRDLPTTVTLEENCTDRGARVRLDAVGIVPKDALLRAEVAAAFEDLVGQPNALAANEFARLRTGDGALPNGLDGQPLADEYLETFDSTAFLDQSTLLDLPSADWGEGRLAAAFEFPTVPSLSPGFDWIVENGTVTVLNTAATDSIQNDAVAGPGIAGQQTVTDGRIFLRDFIVEPNATLRFIGSAPIEIWATGDVEINGTIQVVGFDAENQDSLQSANAIPGAVGVGGGGQGGTASPSNLIVPDEKGGDGFGPFGQPGFGGKGGETAYGHSNANNRRAGGGGGGRLITDFSGGQAAIDGANPTPGNDGTPINPSAPNPQTSGSTSAVDGSSPPKGGATGDSILQNDVVQDNFWGARRLLSNDSIIVGELSQPTPGAGGGAGGDSINVSTYPGDFTVNKNMRGAGGAGGGGLIRISCLGTFTMGRNGLIDVGGGTGGRGERKISDNRGVAGGSGGGSAGMMVLEAAGGFDLSAPAQNPPQQCFLALGGLGGPGKDGNGNAYGSDNSGEAGGGNGGGGIIQLHVFDDENIPGFELIDIGPLANPNSLALPNPQIIFPTFGARSRALSRAIPLGGATKDASALQPNNNLRYGFSSLPGAGGDEIPASSEVVTAEAPLYSGTGTTIAVSNANDSVTLTLADATATDEALNRQLRNTQLLAGYEVRLLNSGGVQSFTVATADFTYDNPGGTLVLTLDGAPDLSSFEAETTGWQVRPRYYRVRTDGVADRLPDTGQVVVEWQGLGADPNGNPNTDSPIVDWTTDPGTPGSGFNDPGLTETIEFFRYRVTFNNDADLTPGLTGEEELPTLEFLRLLFEF